MLIKSAVVDNLIGGMSPTGSVKGWIYSTPLLFEALGTAIVLL